MLVETTRTIIDAVKPTRTFYTLEPMPWMYPALADSYLDLIQAIDCSQFGAHLDPVNVVCSPQRYFDNTGLLHEWFAKLGTHIKSCHAKDILLQTKLTVHLDKVCPGLGYLDYGTYLQELAKIDPDTPPLLEHMHKEEDYLAGASYIRSVATQIGIAL